MKTKLKDDIFIEGFDEQFKQQSDFTKNFPRSKTDYTCPNCEAISSDSTVIMNLDFIFKTEPDPHYSWDEVHKCNKCGIFYIINNAT